MSDAQGHTVTVRIGEREVELRVLDSSDGMEEAGVAFQEVLLLTEWIEKVRVRFFLDSPTRQDRLEVARCKVLAAALQTGCDEAAADGIADALMPVLDSLTPAGPPDLPEKPTEVVVERIARVMEERRKAAAKLLRLLVVDEADRDKEALEALAEQLRDESVLTRVLDAVLG